MMKPSIKNTIMIGMATVLIGTSAVTISYASERNGAQPQFPQSQQFEQRQNGNPLENFGQDRGNPNCNRSQQPQMPDGQQGNNKTQPQTPDNQQGNSNSQQPRMPDNQQGGNNSQQPQSPDSSQGNSNQQQAPSDSQNSNDSKQKGTAASDTDLNVIQTAETNGNTQNTANIKMPADNFRRGGNFRIVSSFCYMFAAVQIAIILAILLYLIISKMNKKSFNEVIAGMRNRQ